jgi:hypothetical protein
MTARTEQPVDDRGTSIVELTMDQDTVTFLTQLAALLRPEVDDPTAMLVQDALRTYEWIIRQQLDDRLVISISNETKAYLEKVDAPDDVALALVRLVPADAVEQVRAALTGAPPPIAEEDR